jgi:hypothetical protein
MGIGLATREWAKYNNEIAKTNILVNGITSLGSDLDNVRVRAMALADYYGQDFNEILNTAKANVKEFGISYIEALDSIIEDGLVKVVKQMENFWNQCGNIPLSLLQQDIQWDFQNLVNSGIDLAIYKINFQMQ